MIHPEWPGLVLLAAGALFVVAGTVGMLRFPDAHSRLHAVTKADNLGLGLIVAGLAWESAAWSAVAKLLAAWLLVLLASTTACQLIAQYAQEAPEHAGRRL